MTPIGQAGWRIKKPELFKKVFGTVAHLKQKYDLMPGKILQHKKGLCC